MPATTIRSQKTAPARTVDGTASGRPAVGAWLATLCGMVVVMVLLGGATRLTGSGLSMTEWHPLTVLPPLDRAGWETAFAAYRASPEYLHKTAGLSLDAFKDIYWLEFIHRSWGRLLGLAVALPLAWFVWRRAVDRPLAWRMAGLFVLGGLQGGVGWLMVKSGLVDRPEVSQYRLAAHLGLAVLLYAALLWTTLTLNDPGRPLSALGRWAAAFAGLVVLTMLAGAFVAGLDAGLAYNTFPLMDGHLVPPGLGLLEPGWRNVFENVTTVQFDHRLLALTTVCGALALSAAALRGRVSGGARRAAHAVAATTLLQAGLGVSTLLLVVPPPLAVLHQGGALLVLGCALWLAAATRREAADAG
jgi:cytochrome c oxidase assembly protein subunit 15